MKSSQNVFTFLLIIFTFFNFSFAQSNEKKKDKNFDAKPIEITTNLLVFTPDNKFDDNVKIEDIKIFEDGIEQKITSLKRKSPVLNVGLVFDNTGSMRASLNEIVAAGKSIVSSLNPTDEAFIVRFTDSDHIEMTQEWTSDKAALNDAIDNLFIEGGQSAVLDAIYLSAGKILEREKNDKSKRYAIVLISDAEERESFYKFDEVARLFKDSEMQVFLLSYAEMALVKKKTARKLTNLIPFEIGGMAYSLPRKHASDELFTAVKAVIAELHSNYTVKYTSTNQNRDGLARKLTVQIADNAKGEKRQGMIRESFVVPKD